MSIGSWWVTGYALRLGIGICLSLIWLWHSAPLFHLERQYLVKWCWKLTLIALVTGRFAYGLMHKAYFLQNPLHIIQLHRFGGLHGGSALIGGLVGLSIWAYLRQNKGLWDENKSDANTLQSFRQLLALFAPVILWLSVGAWWACWLLGCAWGQAVELSNPRIRWLLVNGPDLYHTIQLRYPVQLIGVVWAFALACISTIRASQTYHGILTLALYCLGTGALTLLRGDAVPTIGPVRIDTLEYLFIAIALGSIQILQFRQSKLVY